MWRKVCFSTVIRCYRLTKQTFFRRFMYLHVVFSDRRYLACGVRQFSFDACFSPFFACSKSLDCKKQDVCGLSFASFYHLFGKMFLGASVHERKAARWVLAFLSFLILFQYSFFPQVCTKRRIVVGQVFHLVFWHSKLVPAYKDHIPCTMFLCLQSWE